MSKKAPVLKLSKKTPLKIEAKNGEENIIFFAEIPHWNYVDKKKKELEFFQVIKGIGKQMKSAIEETETLSQITEETFNEILQTLSDPVNLEELKLWFLKNIQALDGIELVLSEPGSEDEIITRLTKDSEWFETIFSELWSYDYNVSALNARFNAYFKGETV